MVVVKRIFLHPFYFIEDFLHMMFSKPSFSPSQRDVDPQMHQDLLQWLGTGGHPGGGPRAVPCRGMGFPKVVGMLSGIRDDTMEEIQVENQTEDAGHAGHAGHVAWDRGCYDAICGARP